MKVVNADDVLKILHKYGKYIFVTDEKRYSSMADEIANLKVLEQEEKTGHWIVHPKGIYAHLVCNKCLSNAPYDCQTNYCPNCGAKMEAEK